MTVGLPGQKVNLFLLVHGCLLIQELLGPKLNI